MQQPAKFGRLFRHPSGQVVLFADIVFQIGTAKYGVRNDEGRLDDGKLDHMFA